MKFYKNYPIFFFFVNNFIAIMYISLNQYDLHQLAQVI